MPVDAPKPKCPKCKTEIVLIQVEDRQEMPDKCAACKFQLKGFPEFLQWFQTAAETYEESQKAKRRGARREEPSIFDFFANFNR